VLQFSDRPGAVEVAEWRDGVYVGDRPLRGSSFRLPTEPANYTFEITAHWGVDYANYDFDLDVR
jgi:hypothetical protein